MSEEQLQIHQILLIVTFVSIIVVVILPIQFLLIVGIVYEINHNIKKKLAQCLYLLQIKNINNDVKEHNLQQRLENFQKMKFSKIELPKNTKK